MTENLNDTIEKMITKLKPSVVNDLSHFEISTPVKRSFSETSQSSSIDENGSSKKMKHENNNSSRFDVSYIGSPREIRRLRADLVEARNTIINLENRIQHMHSVQKEMRIMFENETKSLKRQHEYDRKSIEELEQQLQSVRQREMDTKQELAEMINKYNMLKIQKDDEIEELEKSIVSIKDESRYIDMEENSEVNKLERRVSELETLKDDAEEDAKTKTKLIEELERQLQEKNEIVKKFEMNEQALQAAKLRIKELEYAKDNFLEYQEQAKLQAFKLSNYVEMEKENEALKQENVRFKDEIRNKLILEEEVNDLKSRMALFKEQEKKWAALQAQQMQIEMQLVEWRAVARGICETTGSDSSLPHLLRSAVERLQQQEINLTSTKVELESQLKTVTYEAKVAKSELEKAQKLMSDLKRTEEQRQLLLHRLQKKLLLVSRERDSYRLQLDSYEKDLTMTIGGNNQNVNQLQAQRERIENLEKIVDGYRELNAKLENDLQNSNPKLYEESIPIKNEQLRRLQEQIQQLKYENDQLRERRDELEMKLESQSIGNDTLQGGQVYHLANNPLSLALAQREQLVEKLEQEVERLKRKIKNLEEGLEASKLNESVNPQEIQQLKEQIKTHEAQNQRLKDYFKSSMQEFRNVIYMLLGYKVDRTSNSMYKLTSIYADRAEDQLCFQLNNDGALNLLENHFSANLEDMVNLHLKHQKSIPVFLSAITMDLFNNKTMATKTFEIDD